MPGGTFIRNYDVGIDRMFSDKSSGAATVSTFRIDTYDVTVGRMRAFVNAGLGTQLNPPASGAGARSLDGIADQGGWDPSWNASLPADTSALEKQLLSQASYGSWTQTPDVYHESDPINCVSWYVAFAFCAWDGGFLPTEAQWGYAALGGDEQRAYPWSAPPSSITIDCSYADYQRGGTPCVGAPEGAVDRVGSQSPRGDGRWGQADLAGNVGNWTLDWVGIPPPQPCNDCANLDHPTYAFRVFGGADFDNSLARPASRNWESPGAVDTGIGVRCARVP